jgi:hypothetical protein
LNRMVRKIPFGSVVASATGPTRYSYLYCPAGRYECGKRKFECVNPEKNTTIEISFLDDIPVPTLANYNSNTTLNGATSYYRVSAWGAFSNPADTAAFPSAGTVNGFFPSFWTVVLGTDAASSPVIDLGPPQGTHIFTFELVKKSQ